MTETLDLRLEKHISGLELKPYVSIAKRTHILDSVWRNYVLNTQFLKFYHESQLTLFSNPESLDIGISILPNPKSAHQNFQRMYHSDVVSNDENEEMFPHPRVRDFENMTSVKLDVSAQYSLKDRSLGSISSVIERLGYKLVGSN